MDGGTHNASFRQIADAPGFPPCAAVAQERNSGL
jgi:hypothetical protein